ncbi:hypothetical protein [Sulfobacillus harzensis]|uniref:Uncharacterized protein n=1 Tax=Sulfobacillus harzensis TaxID=2729629 RepID=A0A7Y0L1P2_9FIRM|nr:hypothetical protein [Sulfobacillus harzensis]NMP21657.1 hypothetical protein [Sulfobacillus harzensis]
MIDDFDTLRDEAQGHFLALAELLRDMGFDDIFSRLAELYCDFRDEQSPGL